MAQQVIGTGGSCEGARQVVASSDRARWGALGDECGF